MSMYSVVILTLNEERDLPGCLASVAGCDDIVVLDSGSTDATVKLARGAGARVFVRGFDSFAGQRNYANASIPFRHPWVFHLDADEQMTPELHAECLGVASSTTDRDGYYAAPKMLWEQQWIPHCTDYPAWQARFVKVPGFRFIDVGHGQREAPEMRMGRLENSYLHHLSSGGDEEWLTKHRRYARVEAQAFLGQQRGFRLAEVFARDRLRRRRALKHLSYRLPFRSAARFIYQYFLRRGFQDGAAGLHYCRLLAQYEGFATEELHRIRRETP